MSPLLLILYGVAVTVFAYRRPKEAMVALVGLLPTYGIRFSVAGLPLTLLEVTIWAVAMGWLSREYQQHSPSLHSLSEAMKDAIKLRTGERLFSHSLRNAASPNNPFAPYFWPILLWLVVSTVSMIYSPKFLRSEEHTSELQS